MQQCLQNQIVLKKIYRILQFSQSDWLKSYIDLNSKHRTLSKNTFEQNFFKLMNNAVYGKTMENVEKRQDFKIISSCESKGRRLGARALIAKPNFHSSFKISENMTIITMERVRIVYNKPVHMGFLVLELSKYKMYDFHYSYMKPKFNKNLSFNYMDTDSFIYTIWTEDFYNDIKNNIQQHFDTSYNMFNFPLCNKRYWE